MKKALYILLFAALFGVSTVSAQPVAAADGQEAAAEASIKPLADGLGGRISLDLRNIDIVDALKYFALKTGLNIVTNKSVTGRVTLMVQDAVIKDVLDIMLRSNNLAYDRKGDIYNIMSEEEYRALYGKSFSDVRQVKIFKLNYAIPDQAFSFLDMLKSEIGRILVDPESGNVLVMDSADRIELISKAVKGFEEQNVVKVFTLNYAKAKDIEDTLKSQLDSKKVGLIKASERSNQVIVQTLPDRMNQISSIISLLDQKTKEIIIDARIIKLSLSDTTNRGVEWEGLFDMGTKYGLTYLGSYPFSAVQASTDEWASRKSVYQSVGYVGSYPFSGTTSNYAASSTMVGAQQLHLGVVGNNDFDVVLNYLLTIGKTKILSNPKLVVVNNQEAKIHVGQKEAYVTTTTTTGQTTNTISEEVTFVDVGVMLSVVPTINEEGFITLKVKAEVASVIDALITPTENQIPIIDTSLAETTIMVKDGSTAVIGGLRKEQDVFTSEQLPLLGSIPLVGVLFSHKTHSKEKTELLIMLTPRIISGEVLVANAEGKGAGAEAIKALKEYGSMDKKTAEFVSPSEVYVPLGKSVLTVKGAKTK